MHIIGKWFLTLIVVVVASGQIHAGSPDQDLDGELGGAFGGYMYTVGFLATLSRSQCGDAIKEDVNYSDAMTEALQHFEKEDREKAKLLAESEDMQLTVQQSFDEAWESLITDGFNEKATCQILVESAVSNLRGAKQDWEHALSTVVRRTR